MGGGDESEDRSYAPDGAGGVHRQGRLIQPWIAAGRMPQTLKGYGPLLHARAGPCRAKYGLRMGTNRYRGTKRSRQKRPILCLCQRKPALRTRTIRPFEGDLPVRRS